MSIVINLRIYNFQLILSVKKTIFYKFHQVKLLEIYTEDLLIIDF